MGPPDPFPNPNPNPKSSPNCDPSPSPSPPADAAVRVGLLLSQEDEHGDGRRGEAARRQVRLATAQAWG